MQRSKKLCYGLLSVFFIIFGLSLSVCSDTNALKHEYQGLSLLQPAIPAIKHDSNNYIDWNNTAIGWNTYGGPAFSLSFEGNAWDNSLEDLRVRRALRYLLTEYDSTTDKCQFRYNQYSGFTSAYRNNGGYYDSTTGIDSSYPNIMTNFVGTASISSLSNESALYVPEYYQGNKLCRSRQGMTNINNSSFDELYSNGLPSFPNEREPLVYNVSTVINNDNLLPYWYYTDILPFKDSHRQSDGVIYSKSFSFETIFNRKINTFSNFVLGLDEYSGYWYDDQNLYEGREIDFRFLFRFDEPFTLENTFLNNGSIKFRAAAIEKMYNPNQSGTVYPEYDCTSTVRQVGENDYYWEIDCPVTLETDYIIFVPQLEIDGDGNKVFSTTGNWEFSSVYIVTDNDSTPGYDFNDSPTGNTNIWDSYWLDEDTQFNPEDADWFQSLVSLFTFDFINPFAPIFNLFTDQNACASIPTLAGMINSEETTVCPWFDSTTRNIVTPVLGLASAMLIFGFAVRWLGSSSGNLFEDSSNETISNVNHSGFRRYKK